MHWGGFWDYFCTLAVSVVSTVREPNRRALVAIIAMAICTPVISAMDAGNAPRC
jgi:hypothetical protein